MICYISLFLISQLTGFTDEIVAVVGEKVITRSEIEITRMTTGLPEKDILKLMIQRKLLFKMAEKESIIVSDEEVFPQVDKMVENMKRNFPSEEDFKKELSKQGLTIDMLYDKLTKEAKEELMIQKLLQKKYSIPFVTDLEAYLFYLKKKDSLPQFPSAIKFIAVEVPYYISEEAKEKAEEKASEVMKMINEENFDEIAQLYSDIPRIRYTVRISNLSPAFRVEIENMKPKEIRKIYTKDAIHIIECESKRGDLAEIKDIAIKVKPTKKDSIFTLGEVEMVKELLANNQIDDINYRVYDFSENFIPLDALSVNIDIDEVKEGEIYSFNRPDGFYIMKIIEKREAKTPEFEEIKEDLKNYLLERKLQHYRDILSEEMKKEVYVEVRM